MLDRTLAVQSYKEGMRRLFREEIGLVGYTQIVGYRFFGLLRSTEPVFTYGVKSPKEVRQEF